MKIKKIIAVFAVLMLMLSMTVSAFAANYYEEWGPSWKWTEEQWNAANNWSQEEWDAYYKAEEDAWQLEYKKSMGFTNMDGINVFFDGTCLDFKDVKPVIKNGSTMVPFRTIFEAFGAKVDYSHSTGKQIITASLGDTTLTLVVGQASMTVEKGASKKDVTLISAPYIASGRALVPLRAVSEGLGYDVLWNEWDQVVEIIDRDTLIADIDKRFTLYNRLISDNIDTFDKTYKSKGNISLDVALYGDGQNYTGGIKSSYTALQKGYSVDLKGNIQLDFDNFTESLNSLLGEDTMKILNANKNTPLELIIDGDTFDGYLKSPLIGVGISMPYLTGSAPPITLGEKDWIKFSLNNLLSMSNPAMGNNYMSIFKNPADMTFGKITYFSMVPSDGKAFMVNIYKQLMMSVGFSEIMYGDKYFKKSGSSYVLSMNRMDLIKEISALVMSDSNDVNLKAAMEALNKIPEANYKVTLKENGGRLTDIAMSGNMKIESAVPISISFDMSGDIKSSVLDFSLTGHYFGKMKFHADMVNTETDEPLRNVPPQGENIYKLSDLLQSDFITEDDKTENSDVPPVFPEELKGLIEGIDPLIKAFVR